MQRSVTSQVESRASQTNVTVLNSARAPNRQSSPKVLLNIALSMVIGVMLGIGAVMLLELSDRRVRSLADLVNAENVPLLGELKSWKPANRLLGRAARNNRALPSPG
jgi:capsular polysaccharide biosynthesis protein